MGLGLNVARPCTSNPPPTPKKMNGVHVPFILVMSLHMSSFSCIMRLYFTTFQNLLATPSEEISSLHPSVQALGLKWLLN